MKSDLLRGFVNEMDALASCPYITQLGFLMSSHPSSAALSPSYSSGDFPDCNMLESSYRHLATPQSPQLSLIPFLSGRLLVSLQFI